MLAGIPLWCCNIKNKDLEETPRVSGIQRSNVEERKLMWILEPDHQEIILNHSLQRPCFNSTDKSKYEFKAPDFVLEIPRVKQIWVTRLFY